MQKPYYDKPKFALYQANCLDLLAELPENSVDMVFADPPYLLSNGGFTVHAGRQVSVNKGAWDKSNGLKNDIAWLKRNASPNLSCRFFTASHETLVWARKDKKAKHIFNYDLMKNGTWPEDALKKPGLQMRSVWSMGTPKPIEKKFGKHPTQKPEDLLKRIVLASTNKGDLVLDPFTGSSTTGIASHLFGRHFIGVDLDKQFLDVSIKRFEELDRNLENKKAKI